MKNEKDANGFMNLAIEELSIAQLLLDAGKYRATVTHAYYTMFYAAKALLITHDFTSKRHDTILKRFSKDFVNEDEFDYDIYKTYSNAINRRNKSSYDYSVHFDKHEAETLLIQAEEFINEAKKFLK